MITFIKKKFNNTKPKIKYKKKTRKEEEKDIKEILKCIFCSYKAMGSLTIDISY